MKSKEYLIFIIFIILSGHISLPAFSQESWSLEKCIDYALENNIQIKQQELNTRYSEITLLQSKAILLPTLNGSANHNYSFGRSVDPYTNEFSSANVQSNNFSLNSSVMLFNGFQNMNTIKRNQFDLMASLEDMEKAKNDISLSIASAYLQILFSLELLDIANNQLEITKLQVERTKKLVEAGSLAHGSLLEIQSQEAAEELQVVNAQNQQDISYLTLTQLLDLDSVDGFDIVHPELSEINTETFPYTVSQVYGEAIMKLPQISSAEYRLQSSEKGLSIARGFISPRLTLGASYGTGYSNARKLYTLSDDISYQTIGQTELSQENVLAPMFIYDESPWAFGDQLKDNASTSLYFSLSVPILNGFQTRTSISNAKINLLNSEYSLQLAKNQLYKDIQQAYADALAALKRYSASEKAVSSREESFRYTQQKFDVGLVNSVDYNLAKNNLIKAKSDLLQAKYEFIFKSKILDFYRGQPIKL